MTPYYDHGGITIYHGDCLTIMPELAAQSFDATITDVPYGTTACAWDSPIPFVPMWKQLKRLGKPRAAHVLFGSQPFTSALIASNFEMFKYELIWEKSRPVNFVNAAIRPLGAHENILVFCDDQPTYNPQLWEPHPLFVERRKSFDKLISNGNNYGGKPRPRHKDDGTRQPLSVIPVSSEWSPGMHSTRKPLALMEYLIRTYTNEGDLILDFTCGSGTTLRAAKNLKRRAVGIEQLEHYCEVAVKRLEPAFEAALVDDGASLDDLPLFALEAL